MTSSLPKLTVAQWALLGRLVDRENRILDRYGRIWESEVPSGERDTSFGYRKRKVHKKSRQALLDAGFIASRYPEEEARYVESRPTREGRRAWETYARRKRPRGSSRTTKPCHGCGSIEEHEKGRLCNDCQRTFDRGRSAIDADEAEPVDAVFVRVGVPDVPYQYSPSIEEKKAIRSAWGDLLSAATIRRHDGSFVGKELAAKRIELYETAYREEPRSVWMDPMAAHAISNLVAAVRVLAQRIHDVAYDRGAATLRQLADGETTIDEYLDKLARRK